MIFHMQKFGDIVRAPADSGMGETWRPYRVPSSQSARVASLETLYDFWIDAVTDPDQALMRDRGFRERLTMHPDVAACMNMREQSVVSMEDTVVASPNAKDKEGSRLVAEYVNSVWQRIPNRDLFYQQAQQAILWGGVGHEWMWWKEASGVQRPYDAFPVDKSRFIFDRQGNMALLTRYTPVWGSYVKQMAEASASTTPGMPGINDDRLLNVLPKGKFTYHIYEQDWGTWETPHLEGYLYYGRGEDVNLYEVVTRDFAIWIQEMLWLEQYGRPPRHLYVPPADWNNWAQQIANDLLSKQIVAIPFKPNTSGTGGMFNVIQPEVPKTGFDAFGNSRQRNTASIEKIMLMNAGVLDPSEGGSGGYSAHVSQVESGPTVMAKRDARRIANTITFQLIPSIVRYGPPEVAGCPVEDLPVLRLTTQRENEPKEVVELFMAGSQLAPLSLTEFYEKTGLRKPTGPEDMIFTGQMMDELAALMQDQPGNPGIPSNMAGPRAGENGNGNGAADDHRPRAGVGRQMIRQPIGHNDNMDEEREERN